MEALRKYIDKIKPNFKKGGKFEKLESTFDAFETFLFVPDKTTIKGSHIRDNIDMKRTMSIVVLATLPALFFGMWNVGYQHFISQGIVETFLNNFLYGFLKVLPIIAVTYITGLTVEFIFAQVRGHEVNEGFLVTGILIPLIIPVTTPLWMVSLATIFAVIIGKEVFGGTGMNVFNPALLARAFLFFAYPKYLTGDSVWIAEKADAFSGATPLAIIDLGDLSKMPSINELIIGNIPGSIGETSFISIMIGALILLITGIGSWRIMGSVFLGGFLMGTLLDISGSSLISASEHLFIGGFAFGAVFMATDPVSASQTNTGKYIYGLLIGAFAIVIRAFNPGYPEGMMLSILLMNAFAPLIDYYVIEANIKRRLNRINK